MGISWMKDKFLLRRNTFSVLSSYKDCIESFWEYHIVQHFKCSLSYQRNQLVVYMFSFIYCSNGVLKCLKVACFLKLILYVGFIRDSGAFCLNNLAGCSYSSLFYTHKLTENSSHQMKLCDAYEMNASKSRGNLEKVHRDAMEASFLLIPILKLITMG